ncbi:MAG: ABC transporter ATP-binding protein [Pedobacter sp.]|jgi:lipopolysaccharide transport system ATP-binding protein|uniref:ABC transporter ATP-binding protein n=1 Tax=Pedobacter sp. TaxID=1411316 RepID=UPI00356692AA
MSNIAIKVENLSKAYQLGQIGTGTISRDLERWYARMRGKEDPFLKIGETNNQNTKSESDIVWSLKNVSFEVEKGDAVGIIGRNGAGKSTLLKILSKITSPTTGTIVGNGRIASLLEVGTGFHPELSGRENIFLNGAILGMRKHEIKRKFDEIVEFAGIEKYIDTPVKRYSSGMYVRLAFAVAAHLESEILIVDEVLAVGDAEFQKKCLGKMGEVSKGEGRTVLFVSHNMASIMMLCNNAILLKNGMLENFDKTSQIISDYRNLLKDQLKVVKDFNYENDVFTIKDITIENEFKESIFTINNEITITLEIYFKYKISGIAIELFVRNEDELPIFSSCTRTLELAEDTYTFEMIIPKNIFNDMTYYFSIGISKDYEYFIAKYDNILKIDIENYVEDFGWTQTLDGVVRPKVLWKMNQNLI